MKRLFLIFGLLHFFNAASQSPGGVATNLQLWLKADAGITTVGTKVSQWNDQSGNGRHHSQVTDFYRPTYINTTDPLRFNFQPTLEFNGYNTWLETPSFSTSLTNSMFVFVVSRLSNTYANTWYVTYGWNSDCFCTHWFGNNTRLRILCGEKTSTPQNLLYAINSYIIPRGVAVSDPEQRIVWNGKESLVGKSNYTVNNNFFAVGCDRNYTDFMSGDVAEVIIYTGSSPNSDINNSDLDKIQSYLSIKYGISLDKTDQPNYVNSAGNQIWTGATNLGYQNNIFGIGRDDGSGLLVKQARSHSDQSITMFIDTLKTLNQSNNGTISNDNSFLVLGDNDLNGHTAYNHPSGTSFSNGASTRMINEISNKIWKSQTTTLNTWSVNISTNKYPFAEYVLVSNSALFTPANTRIYSVTNGIAENVSISDGEYVSIGMYYHSPGGVSNPNVWFRTDDAGTISTSWKDYSHNENNIEAVGTWTLSPADAAHNFHPYTTGYSGTKYFREGNSSLTPNNLYGVASRSSSSIFSAVKPSTNNGTGRIVGIDYIDYYAAEPAMSLYVGTLNHYEYYETTTSDFFSVPVVANKSTILSAVADQSFNAGNGQKRLGMNGTYQIFNSPVGNYYHVFGQYFSIGYGTWSSPGAFPGDIMEVIWFNKALTAAEQLQISSYLAIKNGVHLNSDYISSKGLTIWDNASNMIFNNNIFGIGRDDLGSLNQKVSNSINNSTILTAATINNFVLSNNDASRNELNDEEYQLFGDNNNTSTILLPINTADHPSLPAGSELIPRIWLTQEKANSVGNIWLEVDLSSYNISSEVIMIVADNQDLNLNPAYVTPTSYIGGKAVFEYNFNGTEKYFSFVSVIDILGVTLIDFTVKLDNNQVLVEWKTASEVNNDFFTVQRSENIKDWTTIDTVDGAGSSSITLEYSTVDSFPVRKSDAYYRIKQTDFDGSFTYSLIKSVRMNDESDNVFIYPNPANNYFNIIGVDENFTVELYSITGDLLATFNNQNTIDIEHLINGVYYLKIITSNGITNQTKLSVLR